MKAATKVLIRRIARAREAEDPGRAIARHGHVCARALPGPAAASRSPPIRLQAADRWWRESCQAQSDTQTSGISNGRRLGSGAMVGTLPPGRARSSPRAPARTIQIAAVPARASALPPLFLPSAFLPSAFCLFLLPSLRILGSRCSLGGVPMALTPSCLSSVRLGAVTILGTLTLALVLATRVDVASQEFGSITFPTSGEPAAQAAFLTGVKALYNFEFDIAADAFRRRRKPIRRSRSAYWGEAMSYNHPLWAQQDCRPRARCSSSSRRRRRRAPRRRRPAKERELMEADQKCCSAPATSWRATSRTAGDGADAREVPGRRRDRDACTRCRCSAPVAPASARGNAMQAAAIAQEIFQRIRSTRARRTTSSIRSTIPTTPSCSA